MTSIKAMASMHIFDIAEVITPSDTTRFTHAYDSIYVGGEGTIKVQTVAGESPVQTITVPVAPTVLPIRVVKVFSTGTNATAIVGLRFDRYKSPHAKGERYIVGTTTD